MTLTRAKFEEVENILRRADAPTYAKIAVATGIERGQVKCVRVKLDLPPRRRGHPPHLVQAEVADITREMYRGTNGFTRTARPGVVPMLSAKYKVHRNVINRIAYATPGIGEKYREWREAELDLVKRAERRLVLRKEAPALPLPVATAAPTSGPSASASTSARPPSTA